MMKALIASVLFCGCLLYPFSIVTAASGGGYSGPGVQAGQGGGYTGAGLATIEEAKKMSDDSYVTLRGNIVQHIGKDRYILRDNSSTIEVEIDHDKWGGQHVGPEDLVEIYGEVDKGLTSVTIDVKTIRKLAK